MEAVSQSQNAEGDDSNRYRRGKRYDARKGKQVATSARGEEEGPLGCRDQAGKTEKEAGVKPHREFRAE